MITKLVCLGNSYKEGGRCLAGVELDSSHKVVRSGSNPKWIRPICNTPHGEIPTSLVEHINLLDIVTINVTSRSSSGYQSENALFSSTPITKNGVFSKSALDTLCSTDDVIFGNHGKAVAQTSIGSLNKSLMMLKLSDFTIIEKVYPDNPTYPQVRLVFKYKDHKYDLPVTDPGFLHSYKINPHILDRIRTIYVTLSLGVEFNGWYYKLVAAILW